MSVTDTLFLAGDFEAQKMCIKGTKIQLILVKHFLYSILISSRVNMPVGCYYQSRYTQFLFKHYKILYQPYQSHGPVADFSIGHDRKSFADDVGMKKKWFPEDYGYLDNEKTSYLTKSLENIQPRFRSGSMRDKLAVNVSNDLLDGSPVRLVLNQVYESKERAYEMIQPLKNVVELRKKAMLPSYIESEMKDHESPDMYGQKRWLDFILFKGYSQSCEDTYQCYCNNPLRVFYDNDFKIIHPYKLDYRDTNLFEIFIHMFPFRGLEHVQLISINKLMEIKYSLEFQFYLKMYQSFVDALKDELQAILLKYDDYAYTKMTFLEPINKDYEQYKSQLIDNTEEAIRLYKILKNPFTRNEKFRENMSWEKEFPTLQLLSWVKGRILKKYLSEVFQKCKSKYQVQKQTNKSINNFSFSFGTNNKTKQTTKIVLDSNDNEHVSMVQKEE